MIVDITKKILIVGLGLLGGSYARGLKRFGFHISAITKEQSSIDFALKEGIIDEGSTEIDARMIGEADLVIFALYPHIFVEWIAENQGLLKSGALITDVTGVKRSIVYKIQDILRPDVEFVAAHPMAGREVSGVENSTDKMFFGANYIVTPTEKNTPEAVETIIELGRLLGIVLIILGVQSELQAALGVDLFHSDLHTSLDSSTVNCSTTGQRAAHTQLDGTSHFSGGFFLGTTGSQGQNHDQSQHHCDKLFHIHILLFSDYRTEIIANAAIPSGKWNGDIVSLR